MIKTYSYAKDGATKLTPHFRVREFRDKSGGDSFPLDDYLPALLERLYTRLVQDGHKVKAINIVSSYRTPASDKEAGGNGRGPHTKGTAADFNVQLEGEVPGALKRPDGWFLDGKYICTALQDLGCMGIGFMGGRAVHADTRTVSTKWWGDECTGKNVADWYAYFGISKPGAETAPDIIYQVYAKGKKWLAEITNYGDGSNGYAGWPKRAVQGVRAKVSRGHIEIRVHIGGKNGRWLPWVRDGKDYAGLYGKDADGIQMHLVDAPGYVVEYRVAAKGKDYYPWVRDYGLGSDGYAGCYGKPFDRLQCRIVKV